MKQGGEGIIYDLFKQQREIKGGLSRPDSRLLRNQYGIISTGYDRNLSSRLLSSARVIIRGRKGVSKRFHTKKLGDLSLSLRSGLPPPPPIVAIDISLRQGRNPGPFEVENWRQLAMLKIFQIGDYYLLFD